MIAITIMKCTIRRPQYMCRSHITCSSFSCRITEKLQPGCLIQFAGKPNILKKGKVDPITLNLEQRGSKKKVLITWMGRQTVVKPGWGDRPVTSL